MLDKREIETILLEQKQELADKAAAFRCSRREESLVNLDSSRAQVVIGVRRSGKSTLCFNVLHKAGVKYAYVNFDDERFEDLETKELNTVLEVLYKIYGTFTHLFLDEAQNVKGWHLFVNRLLRQGMRVIITGSNAKLLSGELATHLTGRHSSIDLYPFSFREYCEYKGLDTASLLTKDEGLRRAAFDEYLGQGGFPELLQDNDTLQYVSGLVKDILERDIKQRYKVRYFAAFERMSNHLMNVAPTILSPSDLSETFGFGSAQTANNYVKYLKQAYLLVELCKYSPKSKLRVTENKVYTVDVAIMNNRPDAFAGENLGWRLETIVLVELKRRIATAGYDICYYKKSSRAKEVDFVLCKGNKVMKMFQVAFDISKEKTRRRELDALVQAAKDTGCKDLYLLTDHERGVVEMDGQSVQIIPVYEWLLQDGI